MIIGSLEIDFRFPGNTSLKGKRRIFKSFKDRLRNKFNVAVIELKDNDKLQAGTLGLVSLSSRKKILESTFTKVLDFLDAASSEAEIVNYKIDYY